MVELLHDFTINATAEKVFEAVSTPFGINAWWSRDCSGIPGLGNEYQLFFGPGYEWTAEITKYNPGKEFELKIITNDEDWNNALVGFIISENDQKCTVQFFHKGWKEQHEHYRISNYCWAMYLRLLKRYVEHGEIVEFDKRYDA